MVDGFDKASQGYKKISYPFYGDGVFDVRFFSKKLLVPVKAGEEYTWRIPSISGGDAEDEVSTAKKDLILVVGIKDPNQKIDLSDVMAGSSNISTMMPAEAYSSSFGSGRKDLLLNYTDEDVEGFFRHYAGDDFDVSDMGTHKEVMVFDPKKRAFIASENVEWEGNFDNAVRANAGDMVIEDGKFTSDLIISAEDQKSGNHRSFVRLDEEGNIPQPKEDASGNDMKAGL